MGYELIFHYQDEIEKGKYSEEIKTRKVKVGSPQEDVSLDEAAAKIFAQLARRNMLVTDVEIYEFTKKKLSYKEVEDGFLIKNRKYYFDDGPAVISSQDVEESPQEQLAALLAANPSLLSQFALAGGQPVVQAPNVQMPGVKPLPVRKLPPLGKALREEVFDPPAFLKDEIRRRGLPFTIGKRYPIYDEKPNSNTQAGMDYLTVDDTGNRRTINSIHFNLPSKFDGPFSNQGPVAGDEPNLDWGGIDDNYGVPDLRS
jgi:hypothetical protein